MQKSFLKTCFSISTEKEKKERDRLPYIFEKQQGQKVDSVVENPSCWLIWMSQQAHFSFF